MRAKRVQIGVLVALLALLASAGLQHQTIQDWLRLRGYTPPATVVQLATDDGMTPEARHLFYVNRPLVTTGKAFTSKCPSGGEKTVVLGCYISPDQGIYLYTVTDSRLQGVEQVTAAHETLHAAYRRLSNGERKKVDAMLVDYYEHDLTDQRIKDTIAAYKKSEPDDVVNEMHSVFGTEVANLPAPLEQYYKQYFVNRATITSFTARYEGEFTSRQTQVSEYDAELGSLKTQIDQNEAQLDAQRAVISSKSAQLQQLKSSGQVDAYNAAVGSYNTAADNYNSLLAVTKSLINQYNDIVDARNAVAVEEQALTKALTPQALPN